MIGKILESLMYLKVTHQEKKLFDIYCPAITSLLTILLPQILGISNHMTIYGEYGIIQKISSFSQTISGFYIAALAVVSTFNKPDMDKIMPSPAPRLNITQRGKTLQIELTRRRFLSLMFSFLTAESIMLAIITMFGDNISHAIRDSTINSLHVFISGSFLFVVFFIFWQLIYCTFLGLYYLGYRIHHPDAS